MAYIGKRPVDTFPAINAVTSTLIAENNITAREIATNTIVTSLIADNAITAVKIAENVITTRELAANTIATGNIADNAVDGTKIAQNSILTRHIDDAQVTVDQLATDSVTTVKIADDQVTLDKMASLARGKIIYGDASGNPAALALGSNGQVLTSDGTDISWGTDAVLSTENVQDIAGAMFSSNTETNITATYEDGDGTIDLVVGTLNQDTTGSAATLTTARAIAVSGAVTGTANFDGSAGISISTTLANNAVLTQHIDDNQVTADQIAAATITTTQIAANTIATGNVADNAIDGTKIAQNSILTRHIDDGQVTTAQIGADAITGAKIADDAIDSEHYTDGSIDTAHIADDQVTAAKLANTAVTAASYGSSSAIPVITVDAQGRITAASTAATSSTLTIAADSGSNDTVTVGTDTLTFEGTANEITTTVSNNKINVALPDNVTIGGNLTVTGDYTVNGSTSTNSVTNMVVSDNLIELNNGVGSNANDSGIVIERGSTGDNAIFAWDESADKFTLGTTTATGSSTGNLSITTGTLVANVEGNLTGTASAIADNSVTSAKIVNGTIVSADIANNAILTQHIDDDQVTADQIAAATITTTQIAANTIATGNVADNAIDGTKIAQNSILTRHIDDAQVTADQLASSAVTTAKINADAVTGAKIADDAIDSEHYTDGSIDTAHIADDQVTLAKMAGLARGKIIVGDASGNPVALALGSNGTVLKSDGTDLAFAADSGLSTEEVQDIAGGMFSSNTETGITATYQDGDGTIDLEIGAGAIVNSMLADDAVGADELAANAVVSASIVNGSIVSADIAANTIATSNIADNAVDATKLASNSVLTRHIDDNQITGDQLADDLVLSGTGAIRMPDGTTAQRPGSAAAGMFRYNTTLGKFEGYTDSWGEIGGGGAGAFSTDTMTGDNSDTTLTLSQAPDTEADVIVFIDGVFQAHDTYSVSGTTLTFSTAPATGRVVTAYTVKSAVSGTNLTHDAFSGDGSDTTFTLSITPVHENNTQVYVDGVYQFKGTYSVSGTTLTFSTAPPNGTAIEVMTMNQTDINVPVDDTITTAKIADNAITSAKIAAGAVVVADIADNSITSAKIVNGTIVTADLADNSVTAAKIAAGVLTDQVAGISSAADATAITITSAEKVGIGETSPAATLHINTSANSPMIVESTHGDGGYIELQLSDSGGAGSLTGYIGDSQALIASGTAADLAIRAQANFVVSAGGSTERLRIGSNGETTFKTDADSLFKIGDGGTNAITLYGGSGDELYMGANNAYKLRFKTDGDIVMDNGGKFAVGTGSPATKLHIKDDSSNAATQMAFENDARQWRIGVHGGLSDMFTIYDATADATRLSLTSTGDCRFGTTNDMSSKFAVVNTANQPVFVADHANNSGFSQTIIDSACAQNGGTYFFYKAQIRGIANKFIVAQDGNVTNTNNSYGSISDQRLKTDIADASSQWNDIKALKVRKFKLGMQPDDGFKIGVVSQELEASGMNGLVQEKDADEYQIAYNSDLKDQKVKEVKYSVLYMKAVKALQEAMTRIETLEAKVTTLEG